jgi:hypothetical protein
VLPQHGTPQQATAADATTVDQPMDAGAAGDGGGGAAELVVEVVDGLLHNYLNREPLWKCTGWCINDAGADRKEHYRAG